MLAGGTGIAPMYQILQAADANKDVANFILLYSNKTQV
jgi:NAD(P)H-flavin reductase